MDPLSLAGELSTLGLVPVLFWLNIKAERRQDIQSERMEAIRHENEDRHVQMVKGWEKQLNEIIAKYEDREATIRARYDKVIENYNQERDKLFMEIDRKLDDLIRFAGSRNG